MERKERARIRKKRIHNGKPIIVTIILFVFFVQCFAKTTYANKLYSSVLHVNVKVYEMLDVVENILII